jgi:hypothetical protein
MVRYSLSCMTLSFTTPRRFIPTHHKPALDPQPSLERMKIMSQDTSASVREQTPHTINSTQNQTISDALKRRAQSVINNKSIDAEARAVICYCLEINDPWLAELVRRTDAGESIIDDLNVPPTSEEKIEAVAEIISRAGDEPSAALLVLLATLENSSHPKHSRIRQSTSPSRSAVRRISTAWLTHRLNCLKTSCYRPPRLGGPHRLLKC